MQNAVKGLIASGIQVVLPEHLDKIPVETPENIVAVVTGKGGAVSAPVWGYEVQFANQELAEVRVRRTKEWYYNLLKDAGIPANKPSVGRVVRKSHRKVRQTPDDRQKRTGFMNRKAQLKTIKEDLKAAIACYQVTAGTPAGEVYKAEIEKYKQDLANLQAA